MSNDDEYVHYDIASDTAASLKLLDLALRTADADRSSWKWAVVAAHMAASTALVGYLTTTSGIGALDERSAKKLLKFYDSRPGGEYPDLRVAEFPALLSSVAAGEQGSSLGADPVRVDDLVEPLTKLNWLRGRFNHFRDEGWSIQLAYMPPLVTAASNLVLRIHEHGWAFRHGDQQDVTTIGSLAKRLAFNRTDGH